MFDVVNVQIFTILQQGIRRVNTTIADFKDASGSPKVLSILNLNIQWLPYKMSWLENFTSDYDLPFIFLSEY